MPPHPSDGRLSQAPQDERLAGRVVVDLALEATAGDSVCRVLVFDLSSQGCKIEAADHLFVAGDGVAFDLPGGHRAAGQVVWTRQRYAGIVFDQPLHEAVVAYLGFRPTGDSLDFRDQFGRPLPGRFRRGAPDHAAEAPERE